MDCYWTYNYTRFTLLDSQAIVGLLDLQYWITFILDYIVEILTINDQNYDTHTSLFEQYKVIFSAEGSQC